ncbi:MAG: DUF6314 family protein [Pseudomonadota bacterium]
MDNLQIFKSFEGQWRLERQIDPHGHFNGTASFSKIDDVTLLYEETGTLSLEAGEVLDDVSKRYLYKLEGDAIAVYFDDGPNKGNIFHRLNFNDDGIAQAEHVCYPDQYNSTYTIASEQAFTIEHIVNGPRKDYKILSHYQRA